MKKLVALLMILCMVLTLAACGTGSSTGPVNQGNTAVQTEEDTYDGTPPITTKSGQSLKILARTSNYPNVDIAEAEIVKKVIENAVYLLTGSWLTMETMQIRLLQCLDGNVDADIIRFLIRIRTRHILSQDYS